MLPVVLCLALVPGCEERTLCNGGPCNPPSYGGSIVAEDGTIPYQVHLKVDDRWLAFERFQDDSGLVSSTVEDLTLSFKAGQNFIDIRVSNGGSTPVRLQGFSLGPIQRSSNGTWLANGYQSWSISPLLDEGMVRNAAPADRDRVQAFNTDVVSLEASTSWWYAGPGNWEYPPSVISVVATARVWKTRFLLQKGGLYAVQGATGDSVPLRPGSEVSFEDLILNGAVSPAPPRRLSIRPPSVTFQPSPIKPPFVPVGWNSWNTLFDKVTEADVLANAQFIKENLPELGINNIQVDDGWEKNWGEWEANEKFPDGMDGTAQKIREMGFIPGIWFAPFLVDVTSSVAKQHPDWFLRGSDGELVKYGVANFGGGATKLILDTTHPEANAWMLGQIRKIVGWGYRYLKLDFLFGGAIEGKRYDSNKTALEAYRGAMLGIGEAAGPEAYILACGAPLLPSVGVAHGIRIGPDVAFFNLPLEWRYVKAEVLNLATRHFPWPAIAPDPDAALVRDLPENEARFFLSAALMAPGIFAIGDHLPALPPDRLALYRRIAPLIPLLYGGKPEEEYFTIPDLFQYPARIIPKTNLEPYLVPGSFPIPPLWIRETGKSSVVAVLNGEDSPRSIDLDVRQYDRIEEIFSGERMVASKTHRVELGPREGRLYLLTSP